MIVTITPTVMDGTVLRWWDTDDPEQASGTPLVSVSRNRLEVGCDADDVPEDVQRAAIAAFAALKADRYADVRGYATHLRVRGGIVPIEKTAVTT